jgi:hypothetical protein
MWPNLKFSAPSLRSMRLCGECIYRLFTAETQRSRRLRREKLKLRHQPTDLRHSPGCPTAAAVLGLVGPAVRRNRRCPKRPAPPGAIFCRHAASRLGHFFTGDFCGAALAVGDAEGEGDGCSVGAGEGCGACSGTPDCSTEPVPVTAGSESVKAINMNAAAAPMVIFASRVCVPRGPNAVLETELEKSAPASDFPGCNRITRIRTTQARMNNPYRV